jgi:heme/copper-type cytochrome/quinol oxidase subunit 3
MTSRHPHPDFPGSGGATTGVEGTPVPVDVAKDRPARLNWIVFLAGPVIWITHFMIVYLAAEAGCTGDGPGLNSFDPPTPRIITLVVTAAAALACLPFAVWGYRWWNKKRDADVTHDQQDADAAEDVDNRAAAGFAGLLLTCLAIFSILFVGLMAVFLGC